MGLGDRTQTETEPAPELCPARGEGMEQDTDVAAHGGHRAGQIRLHGGFRADRKEVFLRGTAPGQQCRELLAGHEAWGKCLAWGWRPGSPRGPSQPRCEHSSHPESSQSPAPWHEAVTAPMPW